ncbi:MAG: putative transport system permease protein [Pseudonocardiales bacterium]|nr:putative transport system permease protein [Pseudonocardiales bacterium]
MHFREALTIAARSMRANRLRSALTTLGIVIGVTAVIVLVGFGQGMKAGFNKSFGELATAIIVTKVDGSVPGGGAPRDLRDADVTALMNKNVAPDIATVTPVANGKELVEYRAKTFRASVAGSTTGYLKVNNREITAGKMFDEEDERLNSKVVLLGPEPVKDLYGDNAASAVGTNVRIGRITFKVIGTLKSDGNSDDVALMPLGTARAYLVGGADKLGTLVVKAASVNQVTPALEQTTRILSERHHIREESKRDFDATALQNQLDQINQFLTFLTLFIIAVAAISLLVGGIGVANIMLVSVTERTREIGIRKAIGARRSAIMKQFLIESTVLAGVGGLFGIVSGVGITLTGAYVLPKVAPDFGTPEVSVVSIVVAIGVSLIIGLVAGGYPAMRASRLQPIEALRFQ